MKTDICLILEGTYPYVYGGVSSWIHQIVKAYPDLTFSIVHISSTGDTLKSPKYQIPSNILAFKEIYIHDFVNEKSRTYGTKKEGWDAIKEFYGKFSADTLPDFEPFYEKIIDPTSRRLNTNDILYSKDSWNLLIDYCKNQLTNYSFVDLYWTLRFIHVPILALFNATLPDASVYHTVCTGYAGLLAVIAKLRKKAPMILTEHGIYTYERQIEISRAKWLQTDMEDVARATRSLGYLKDLWNMKFQVLSKLAYRYADQIVTLFDGNRRVQIHGGADPGKIRIIPNGIDIPAAARKDRKSHGVTTIGFVGRIVPIKDVKTLIRAVKIVKEKLGDLKVYIMGEGSENPAYVTECRVLSQMLGLEQTIQFTGNVDVEDYYPELDLVVLTSISEAQPLSLLEAMSYGVPVVASDVGACRELLFGRDNEDKALGSSGLVSNIGNPNDTADAIVKIIQDEVLWKQMSRAGRNRVQRFYTSQNMIDSYRELYNTYLKQPAMAV